MKTSEKVRQRKRSKKREAILDLIRSSKSHPCAQWVYERLKPSVPDLSLGTVYRNLALFAKEGEVALVGVVKGEERFDGNVSPHPHFICECCGKIFDYSGADMEKLKDLAHNESGFQIDYERTVFKGLCAECATQIARRGSPEPGLER